MPGRALVFFSSNLSEFKRHTVYRYSGIGIYRIGNTTLNCALRVELNVKLVDKVCEALRLHEETKSLTFNQLSIESTRRAS
jgi:hypothetical protein